MRSPWKRLNPKEPNSGSEELSIGLPWLMSLRHNSEKQTESSKRGGGEEGMRWDELRKKQRMDVRERALAVEEYLLGYDGRRRDNQQNQWD